MRRQPPCLALAVYKKAALAFYVQTALSWWAWLDSNQRPRLSSVCSNQLSYKPYLGTQSTAQSIPNFFWYTTDKCECLQSGYSLERR